MKVLEVFSIVSTVIAATNGYELCKTHLTSPEDRPFVVHDVDLSPVAPTTGDTIELSFSATALKDVQHPVVSMSVSVLGIEIESQEFDMCSLKGRCFLFEGESVGGNFRHELHSLIPEGVETKFTFNLFDKYELTSSSSCVEATTIVHDGKGVLSSRFGFDEAEVDFLFWKWNDQHGDEIHYPKVSQDVDRKTVFASNLAKIASHNANPESKWKMGMNQFGHLTSSEFKSIFASGYRGDLSSPRSENHHLRHNSYLSMFRTERQLNEIPSEVNWVSKGGVTAVKNQGACGSCWSFASTGAMEGAYFAKYNKLVSFSEQELVSCDHVDLGCGGGAMDNAFEFIKENHGLCSEDSFPYTSGEGVRGFCNVTCSPVSNSEVKNWVDVQHDEQSLMEAVAKQPVAVAIEADEASFQFYTSGVLTATCSQKLDHGVLAVGYGVEDGVEYWLIKNSWGALWGLDGYIKIERGIEQEEGGECGVLLQPSYPLL